MKVISHKVIRCGCGALSVGAAITIGLMATPIPVFQMQGGFVTYISDTIVSGTEIPCRGGLTHHLEISDYLGADYYPIHVECGGAPILKLKLGDNVTIANNGNYKVVDTRVIPYGNVSAAALLDLAGEIILQTCYPDNSAMRAVGLQHIISAKN